MRRRTPSKLQNGGFTAKIERNRPNRHRPPYDFLSALKDFVNSTIATVLIQPQDLLEIIGFPLPPSQKLSSPTRAVQLPQTTIELCIALRTF